MTDRQTQLCECGHPKDEHDWYGCMHGSCQFTCKKRHGALLVGKHPRKGDAMAALHD